MTPSNYISLILLVVIISVFIIDFIIKKKSSETRLERFVDSNKTKVLKNSNLLNLIIERKKNLTLSIVLIPILKAVIHYLTYPERYPTVIKGLTSNYIPGTKKPLGYHFEIIFEQRNELFIPIIFVFLVIVWFFNDKIKAQ